MDFELWIEGRRALASLCLGLGDAVESYESWGGGGEWVLGMKIVGCGRLAGRLGSVAMSNEQ